MDPNIRRLKELKQQERAEVIVGRTGLTEGVLEEIDKNLRKKKMVKVKMLKTALKSTGKDRFTLAKEIAERLNAKLVEVRGRTLILYRENMIMPTVGEKVENMDNGD